MYLIRQITSSHAVNRKFKVYKKRGTTWFQEDMFEISSAQAFYTHLKSAHLSLEYGIIHLETVYRNILYQLYPHIKIAIDESAMRQYVISILEGTSETYEEIAISLENGKDTVAGELLAFINMFYGAKEEREALLHYARWQYERPLNEKKLTRFERVMEFYLVEILNYFELKRIDKTLEI